MKGLLFLLSTLISLANLCASQCVTQTYTYSTSGIANNPLRGFVPYQDSAGTFPCSMEYTYVAMNDLMNGENSYTWSFLDEILDDIASRNHQTIFRIYLDYPDCCPDGTYATGVPAFLTTGANPVTFTSYTDYGGGKSPDYTNARLISAIESLVSEMAKKYDGDRRIAFIKVGLLGFWGEWHTYPHDTWMATRQVQTRVLQAFDRSFNKTQLVVSADELNYWTLSDTTYPQTSTYRIGWHDDAFAYETYSASSPQSYYFYNKLSSKNLLQRYLTVPIGGEVYPDIQGKIFATTPGGQNFTQCVANTHASWLLNQFAFDDTNSARIARTKTGALLLGYQFHVPQIKLERCSGTNCYNVSVSVRNTGSAPFYYPVYLKVTLQSGSPAAISSFNITQSLQSLYPSNTPTIYSGQTTIALGTSSTLKVALVSNHVLAPIVFANNGATSNGIVTINLPNLTGCPA